MISGSKFFQFMVVALVSLAFACGQPQTHDHEHDHEHATENTALPSTGSFGQELIKKELFRLLKLQD